MAIVQNYMYVYIYHIYNIYLYMNICQAPPLEMSPKHFTMATIALVLPTTVWLNATE